jgi:hypothetical protein
MKVCRGRNMAGLISNIGSYMEVGDKHHSLAGLPLGMNSGISSPVE